MTAINHPTHFKTLLKCALCCCIAFPSVNASGQGNSFNKYHVSLYQGKPAKILFKSNATALMFLTMIRYTYYSNSDMKNWHGATGLNFAGHYCFAYWGCGSPCKMAAIVDLKTGIVYDAPPASYDYKFKRDCRLVIVNPDLLDTTCAGCTSEYWVWNDDNKKFVKLK